MTFFPQHFLGLAGIPRRYSDYPDSMAWGNLISSFGSTIRFVGVVLFISMMVESLSRRRSLVFSSAPSRRLEWLNANDHLPMAHHNSEECLFISHR
jgi:cytochrome c oxidase subunit 1